MSVLSDRGLAALYPHFHGAIGPASIDLRIGDTLLQWPSHVLRDPRTDQSDRWQTVPMRDIDGMVWVLRTGTRYLATTRESITVPTDHAAQIAARSSWGRDGLSVICGPAGWIDPGYVGRPTLELAVIGSDLVLWPGALICQLIVMRLDQECEHSYGGKYLEDTAPTPSRLWQETV